MFLLGARIPQDRRADTVRALERHFARLAETGYVGHLVVEDRGPFLLAHDGASSHAIHGAMRGGGWQHGPAGEYALIDADGTGLTARSDPAGSWPLFYADSGDTSVVSNDAHAVAIVAGRRRIDPVVAVQMLLLGHAIDRGTTIEGVSRLWPGEQLRLGPIGASTIAPAAAYGGFTRRSTSMEEHAQHTFDDLVAGIAQMPAVDEHAVLQLSGGLDSRLTVAALQRAGVRDAQATTLAIADEAEVSIAREVTDALGFSHSVLDVAAMGPEHLRSGWLLTGGQVSPIGAAGNLAVYEAAASGPTGAVNVWGAWPGDCLVGSYVPNVPAALDPRAKSRVVRKWAHLRINSMRAIVEAATIDGHSTRSLLARTHQTLVDSVDPSMGETAAEVISWWAMFRRQPAFSYLSPARLTADVLEVTPVLTPAYVRDLLELSGVEVFGRNFYRQLIWSALPELRHVAYHNTGRPITPDRVLPARRPPGSVELLYRLPAFVGPLAIRARRRLRGEAPASYEEGHWRSVLGDGDDEHGVTGLRIDLGSIGNGHLRLHAAAMLRALAWTERYLSEA